MKFKFSKPLFKKLIKTISDIVTDVQFVFKEDGIHMQSMDSSHVCLVELFIRSSFFDLYESADDCSICINLINFEKILSMCDENVLVSFEQNSDKLNIKTEKMSYDISLMDLDTDSLNIEADYNPPVVIKSAEFSKLIKDFHKLLATDCTFHLKEKTIDFIVKSEVGSGLISLNHNSELCTETALSFKVNLLQNIAKAAVLSDDVSINIKEGLPLCCTYNFDNGSYINFYLAPLSEE